jgi:hypothetical protein
MPADRPHDVSGLTAAQLDRARRDLQISLALTSPGSPVRVPILAEMTAIDTELARTRRQPMTARDLMLDAVAPGNGNPREGRADG